MGMMRWAMTEGIIISGWVRVLLLHRPKWFSQFIVFEFIHAVGWFTIIKRPGQFIRTLVFFGNFLIFLPSFDCYQRFLTGLLPTSWRKIHSVVHSRQCVGVMWIHEPVAALTHPDAV